MSTMTVSYVPTYRLTRRGRLVVFLLSLVAVVAVGVALAAGSVATSHDGGESGTKVVHVAPGQTLWDVASAAGTGGDVRDMMTKIEQLNGLDSATLQAGQRLRVPVTH